MTAFEPTRHEIADALRFAAECERNAWAAQLHEHDGTPWSLPCRIRASNYSDLAFLLSKRVAARAGQ